MNTQATTMVNSERVKGILTLCGGVLIHLSLGTLYTFGNIDPYVTSYLRIHTSDVSLDYSNSMWIFATAVIGQGVTMVLGGVLDRTLGYRWTSLLGGLTMSFGVLMTHFSVQKSFAATVITYGFLFGFGIGIVYAIPMSCAMKWFPNHKGLINGIIVSGFGAGAFIFDFVQTDFINPDNLKANLTIGANNDKYFDQPKLLDRVPNVFILLGCIYATMQLIGSFLLTQPSNQGGRNQGELSDTLMWFVLILNVLLRYVKISSTTALIQSDDSDEESTHDSIVEDKDPRRVIMTRSFWTLWFTFLVNGQATVFTATLYKAYGQTFISNDHFLAVVGSFAAVFNGLGRILWGYLADRFTYKLTMIAQCSSMAFLFLTFILTEKAGSWMFFIWVCLMFGTLSGNFALFPTAIVKSFGPKYFTLNYGMLFTSQIVCGVLGVLLAENLSDYLGWIGIFFMVAGFSVVGLILTLTFNVKKPNGKNI